MKDTLLRKLVTELQRYQNKDFLKAAMAVCALSAIADGDVSLSERYSIDHAIANEPALQPFDAATAIRILDDYIFAIREEAAVSLGMLLEVLVVDLLRDQVLEGADQAPTLAKGLDGREALERPRDHG